MTEQDNHKVEKDKVPGALSYIVAFLAMLAMILGFTYLITVLVRAIIEGVTR